MYVLSSGLYPEKQHCGCEVQVESNAAKNMVALPGSKLRGAYEVKAEKGKIQTDPIRWWYKLAAYTL